MARKPSIALPPTKAAPATPDAFVAAGADVPEEVQKQKPKRLTIDVSPELHQAFKLAAVSVGRDMRDIMSDLIARFVASHEV